MDKIFDSALKSQTGCGAVHFVLFLVSWPTIIDSLNGLHGTDRLNFNCIPKPSEVTKQLCYGDYISTMSPLLIPLNFAYIICGILGFFWLVFILHSVLALRRINKEQDIVRKERLSKGFMWRFLFHVCIQLAVLGVMMGIFCHFQTLHLPEVYMCQQGNTTQIPTNQVNMTCSDLHRRQKSRLNDGIVAIMAISMVLCIVSIIHLFLKRKNFLQELLGDQESDIPAAIRLVQRTEKDVKGINREQELDQYEDHKTWLEMVKQDYWSFICLLNEEQTDQQRKRLNLFVARFQDQFPAKHKCNGCSLKLSGIRYRCLNCVDVDFCYDCYMKRVEVKGHSENHKVIEMRFKCADCKGFILGTRFCCYECPEFFLCSECQSRHLATHKVTTFPVNQEPFVEKCQKQLHSHYNTFNRVKIIPWDRASAIHIDDIYTQLSWVRDDRKASGVTQKELEDYTDIFKGDEHYPNPKRLLVYGRPGVGKSTFSQKTAFDWSNQRKGILLKFDVVLLIKLRDVCDLKDIRDVLRASELLAGDEVDSADGVYEYIFKNQEKVLLILDGYDEYFCTCNQSPVRDIWEDKLLRDMHVIITTRHEKTDELRLFSHVQYEINGFKSDDQVRAFASKFLRDQDVKEFLSYLKENNLRGIAEIPLLLCMLCLVWKENHQRELLKSRADIYTKCLQTLLHHAIERDAKPKQFRKINDYNEQLCELGKFALDALSEDKLAFPLNKLPDGFLATELIEVGLFHVLNVSSVDPEKDVYFLHKSVQEFLAAFYLKEELLKETSTACLSQVDSMKKIIKMTEVLRFACELSADVEFTVLSHLGIVGKKEGLTEYNFTETLCIRDLSDEQQLFLTLISHAFFCCASEKRRDLYPVFLSYAGGVLLIDSDQLHSIANTHMLKSAAAPELILFSNEKHTEQSYQDLISVLEDISAVIVSCSGEKKASEFLKKYSLHNVDDIFLKKEEGKIYLYISQIGKLFSPIPTAMLRELLSSPEFTQSKKPVDNQANEQDDSIALCLTENSTSDTQATQHCLSCVSRIDADVKKRQKMETLIDVLAFVRFPRSIVINGHGSPTDPVLVDKLVSHINFTNRLEELALCSMNLTAKPASVIARSLYQAPNMRMLDFSWNPLGEGVSDLARHLCCNPDLQTLNLFHVKMTKKQVNDLSEAVYQRKIHYFWSSYHDKEGNPKPEHEWPSEDDRMNLPWLVLGTSAESEDEREPGSSVLVRSFQNLQQQASKRLLQRLNKRRSEKLKQSRDQHK